MRAFKYNALLIHFSKANFTIMISVFELDLHFLSEEDEDEGSAYFSSKLLNKIVAFQERVSDSNKYKVGANKKKNEFIEKYGFESAIKHKLENKQCREGPFNNQNGNETDGLAIHHPAHDPVEKSGRYHADRSQADVHWDEHQPMNI